MAIGRFEMHLAAPWRRPDRTVSRRVACLACLCLPPLMCIDSGLPFATCNGNAIGSQSNVAIASVRSSGRGDGGGALKGAGGLNGVLLMAAARQQPKSAPALGVMTKL